MIRLSDDLQARHQVSGGRPAAPRPGPAHAPTASAADNRPQTAGAIRHLMTIDVEEYFQVESAAASIGPDAWHNWPSRIQPSVERILALLERHQTKATFFVLGWVANQHPYLVRAIAQAGHEVASHGMSHAMITRLSPQQFRGEILDSRKMLQDISGQEVIGYRAPTFSIMHQTAWALDELVLAGYKYDSSVFTVRHDRYGVPEAPPGPHMANAGNDTISILEIPPLTLPVGRRLRLPMGGGGYLRLLPTLAMEMAITRSQRNSLPAMIYLHPWELDPGQPLLPMPRMKRWRHRVGLAGAEKKLDRLLTRYSFAAVEDCLPMLRSLADSRKFTYGRPGQNSPRQ